MKSYEACLVPRRDAVLLATLMLGCFVGAGIIGSIGVFLSPIRHDFGWGNARVSHLPAAFFLGGSISAVGIGRLLDILGARAVMTASILLMGIFLLLASVSHVYWTLVAAFLLAGAASSGTLTVPCVFIAAKYVRFRLGISIALIICASSVGSGTLPILTNSLVAKVGWRSTLAYIGIVDAALLGLLALICIPDGNHRATSNSANDGRDRQPSRTRPFPIWQMSFSALTEFFFLLSVMTISVHFISLSLSKGISAVESVRIYGLANAIVPVGLLLCGWMAERTSIFKVMFGVLLANTAAYLILYSMGGHSWPFATGLFVILWGLASGGVSQLMPVVINRFAPTEALGFCLGIMGLIDGIASATGSFLGGILADRPGGYQNVIIAVIVSVFISMLMLLALNASTRHKRLSLGYNG